MKVLYDSQAFDMQTHGGVSRCFAELYSHMPKDVDAQIAVVETNNVYLQNLGFKKPGDTYQTFMNGSRSKWRRMKYKLHYNFMYGRYRQWDRMPNLNLLEQERLLREQDYDVFHPTFFGDANLALIGEKPFVVTVHDMIPEIYTKYYQANDPQILQKKAIIPKATHLVAVSEQTKKDLMRIMNIPEQKITVVYHGADESPYIPSADSPYDFEYILYVGERHFYKNFIFFCRDCMPILKRHKNLKVICTGVPFTWEENYFIAVFGMEDRFIQTFVQSDQEFMDLYHHAVAFVYPSEYEGFGIPILEAYKADCPVMLNRRSCFPEIAGDAAVYFNLDAYESDFEEQFETLYHLDGNEREALLVKQRERLKRYSWTKSAQQLADVYRKLA